MADVYGEADSFRAALLRRDAQASRLMVAYYASLWRSLQADLDALTRQITEARLAGTPVTRHWLFRQERTRRLLDQLARGLEAFARLAEGTITAEQQAAIDLARQHAMTLLDAITPPGTALAFAVLPSEALTQLVGTLRDGTPLRSLLDELAPDGSQQARNALVQGVARGANARQIGRDLRTALGGNLVRSITIARTETLRSYRESSRLLYQQSGVATGWVWRSARTRRTCAFCWSMHGTIHPLSEYMKTHPRCRCTMVPWRPERPTPTPGSELFDTLSEADQRFVLGPAKYRAYQGGALQLDDLRGFARDPKWGVVGYERSLTAVLGDKAARFLKVA